MQIKTKLILILLLKSCFLLGQNRSINKESDTISILIQLSRDKGLSKILALSYAESAVEFSKRTNEDSIVLRSYRNLARLHLNQQNYKEFGKVNFINLELSEKLNDTVALASANNNLGWFYSTEAKNDSSYFYYSNAVKLYSKLKDNRNQGEVLLNMAHIQESERDYIGAEINAFEAIKLIEKLPETENNLDTLWSLHNLIGFISLELRDFERALEYHNKSLKYSNKISDNYYYNLSTNLNLSRAFKKNGEYDKSISLYNELLKDENLFEFNPSTYIKILNNLAYTRLINKNDNSIEVYELLKESYRLNDSIQDQVNTMGISNSLAEYFLSKNEKDSAFYYNNQALKLARELNSNETLLESLILMSRIKGGDEGIEYLNEHRVLSDSLLQRERAYRDKFVRIDYETDKLEADNATLSKERLLFLILSIGLFALLALVYVVITQRNKNRELKFAQTQQQANEEIYNLMLVQQDKIEEGRTVEKKRISQELHDGILGRLFGTRLSLDSLNMVHTDDAVKNREKYINELQTIEQEIRKISHDLNADFIVGTSFIDIVKTLIETQTQAYGLEYHFTDDTHINWDEVTNKNKIHIYRMLQETMQNIYKHAKASYINIGFQLKKGVILVTVGDDGIGFNTEKAKKGIGIKNINARVKDFGGKVNIDSVINEGTIITITIPLN
ncbi:two-component sensor histidine kinase [Flavobacteriaceae bacterium AU392]|nr:two-component sensor histidine kinase [Flavobacteriaceae bacterium]RKM84180.1 two-component sensor histidine kinase [Flavobacteriaceae bacterium AU392]